MSDQRISKGYRVRIRAVSLSGGTPLSKHCSSTIACDHVN